MNCPHCGAEITLAHLKALTPEALASLRGLVSAALRKTPPKAGPGRGHKKVINA